MVFQKEKYGRTFSELVESFSTVNGKRDSISNFFSLILKSTQQQTKYSQLTFNNADLKQVLNRQAMKDVIQAI